MATDDAAFMEAISVFSSTDFSNSHFPELQYWRYIMDGTNWPRNGQELAEETSSMTLLEEDYGLLCLDSTSRKRDHGLAFQNPDELFDFDNIGISVSSPQQPRPATMEAVGISLQDLTTLATTTPPSFPWQILPASQNGEDNILTISPSCHTKKAATFLMDAVRNNNKKLKESITMTTTSDKTCSAKKTAKAESSSSISKKTEMPVEDSVPSSSTFTGLAAGTNGENRLRVHFDRYGTRGRFPQRFGKSGCYIPDGLQGSHEMYDQHWRFNVIHDSSPVEIANDADQACVQITWMITNLSSGLTVQLKESPQQAMLREYSGRTICNKVVKMALSARAEELEKHYHAHTTSMDQAKRITMENSIRVLRPRLCTVGLLFFGLLHDSVQMNLL